MSRRLHWGHPLSITMLAVGLVACNNPTFQREMPTASDAPSDSGIEIIDRMDQAEQTTNELNPRGQVWFDGNGEVIGILFQTSGGYLLDSKDGFHSGFIRTEPYLATQPLP